MHIFLECVVYTIFICGGACLDMDMKQQMNTHKFSFSLYDAYDICLLT